MAKSVECLKNPISAAIALTAPDCLVHMIVKPELQCALMQYEFAS